MGLLQRVVWRPQTVRKPPHLVNSTILIIKRGIKKPSSTSANNNKLAEVGRLEPLKTEGKYETGQLFLHRIFSYRGVVLFPWTAKVYDRDLYNPKKAAKPTTESTAEAVSTTTTSSSTASATTASATAVPPPDAVAKSSDSNTPTDKPNSVTASLKSHLNEVVNTLNAVATATAGTKPPELAKPAPSENKSSASSAKESNTKEVKGKPSTFYQVLIDSRDCPFIRAQTEAVTFLGSNDSNRSLYAIPGLDYVSHDDIMPYSSTDKTPLQHELFEKFLNRVPDRNPPFEARDTLKTWQDKNHPWLELSDVHKETTDNIRVTVIPFYMGCRETPSTSVYWWRYSIRLENLGTMSVQLRERHWRIFSLSGTLETVRGRGVVGQEPILSKRLPAFQYSSHVSLQAPSGHMWGTFRLEREDGHMFDCKIPPFSLESKPEEPTSQTKSSEK